MTPARRIQIEKAVINPALRVVLRSPLHRFLSESFMVLEYEGRRSGRRRSLVVAYAPNGAEDLVVAAGDASVKQWWHNFRTERPLEITLRGRRQAARARVLTNEDEIERSGAAYALRFPRFAGALGPDADVVFLSIERDHV